mmetsp:Transcript_71847/g.198353  ORF Transcript_71847/g.198353 Transcript_71847/m.198353 type:complete len:517 (+) Transcript_71847:623-2173(+)
MSDDVDISGLREHGEGGMPGAALAGDVHRGGHRLLSWRVIAVFIITWPAGQVDRPILQQEKHPPVPVRAGELDHRWLAGEKQREKLRRRDAAPTPTRRAVLQAHFPGHHDLPGLGKPEIAGAGWENLDGRVVCCEHAGIQTLEERRPDDPTTGERHAQLAARAPDLVALGVNEVERRALGSRDQVPQRTDSCLRARKDALVADGHIRRSVRREALVDGCGVRGRTRVLGWVVAARLCRCRRVGHVEVTGVIQCDGDAPLQHAGVRCRRGAIAEGGKHALHALYTAPMHLERRLLLLGRLFRIVVGRLRLVPTRVVGVASSLDTLRVGASIAFNGAQVAIALCLLAGETGLLIGASQVAICPIGNLPVMLPGGPFCVLAVEEILEPEEVVPATLAGGALTIRRRCGVEVHVIEEGLLIVHCDLVVVFRLGASGIVVLQGELVSAASRVRGQRALIRAQVRREAAVGIWVAKRKAPVHGVDVILGRDMCPLGGVLHALEDGQQLWDHVLHVLGRAGAS